MKKKVLPQTLIAILLLLSFVASALLFAFLALCNGPTKHTASTPIKTIIIDAGQGGEDGGAIGDDGTCEKDLNLDIQSC